MSVADAAAMRNLKARAGPCPGFFAARRLSRRVPDPTAAPSAWRAAVPPSRFPSRSENTMSGNNTSTPSNFVVALLAEDRSEFLIFYEGNENWLEYGDYTYHQCNW